MTTLNESALQAAAEAIAGSEIGYEIKLTKFVDGVSEYSVTFPDGGEPRTFPGYSAASEYVERERNLAKAKAAVEAYLAIADGWMPIYHEARSGEDGRAFSIGDHVRKTKGSSWQGKIVGFYSTDLTPVGYCVESEREPGSVQIYPQGALEAVPAPPSIRSDDREGGR